MNRRIVKEFKNFTSQMNQGFKIAFPNRLVVSVVFFDHNATEGWKEDTDKIERIDIKNTPIFTFNQADLCVFNQDTNEYLTGLFCKEMENYDEYNEEVIFINPIQLTEILTKVSQYTR